MVRHRKRALTQTQLGILEHLAAVAVGQKRHARATKTAFRGGWTYVRPTRHVPLRSLQRLITLGYVSSCCRGHFGTDTVRISRSGIELLEQHLGKDILA